MLDIKRVSPGNSAVTTLATGVFPSVSPNGKKVAYLSNDIRNLYVMNIDGSNPVLLDSGVPLDSPAWLPDGSKVVFGRVISDAQVELWAVNPDGSGKTFKRNLAPHATTLGPLYLAWSPSGNSYTFRGFFGTYIANDVTSAIDVLVQDAISSSWAPDAASILISGWDHYQFEINPEGSNRRYVIPGDVPQAPSAISPDGKFIAGGLMNTNRWPLLVTRDRAGSPTTFSWPDDLANKTDWSRVPKNCYASTPQGGGAVLAGDTDFYASQCALAVMPDGGQHGVFQQAVAVGPDGRLYHRAFQYGPNGRPPSWTPFAVVPGGGGNPNGINAKKIAIAAAKDGSAQVVIINAADNLVYHAMRYANGSWSGFNPLDGYAGAPNFAARTVAITINNDDNTAQVIANGLTDGNVFHRVRRADGTWSPFAGVPGLYDNKQTSHELAIAADASGYTDVVATLEDSTGAVRVLHQTRRPDSSWDGNWAVVGSPKGTTFSASSDVAVARTLSGTAQLLFTDSAGNALFQTRPTPNVPASWQEQVTTTPIISTTARKVSISPGPTTGSTTQLLLTRTFAQ